MTHTPSNTIRVLLVLLVATLAACSTTERQWDDAFRTPTTAARPWTFYYWLYGCASDSGIVADLIAMKEAHIDGFYLMPIKSSADDKQGYGGDSDQLTDTWWHRMDVVFRTADSLGLQMGIHFCDGFALAGGPWIEPDESMKRVVWKDTVLHTVDGSIDCSQLSVPQHNNNLYRDIATYVYPATYHDPRQPTASHSFPLKSKDPVDVLFSYDEPFTLRSVEVQTGGNNYQAHRWSISASADGTDYSHVATIEPARQGWQNTDCYATYALPTTTARYFKFSWSPEGSDPGSEDMDAAKWSPTLKVKALRLSAEPTVDGYEGKSGAVWRVKADLPDSLTDAVSLASIKQCQANETVTNLADGLYHVLRMGYTSTGHTNATGGGGRGLECDKFSAQAIKKQYANWFATIKHRADSILGNHSQQVLTRLHIDSWECGSQNWSETFESEFEARRGYNLLPYLPAMAGVRLESEAQSNIVLRHVRETIAELISNDDGIFYKTLKQLADADNMKLSAECVCPTMVSDGLAHYKFADYPMGEFWLRSPTHDKPNDMLDAISGAHIYGKPIVQAEAVTEVRGTWDETPAMLKPLLDRSYCMGINAIVYHVMTLNPWMDRSPGMTLDGIGTFFQRDNTWWKEMDAFGDYIARCQSLLQLGEPVVDIAIYIGEETPRRAMLPERLAESLPGLFGSEAVERERQRLLNDGVPMETSPVGVRHTKNMTTADLFTNPLRGYKYDSVNLEALDDITINRDGSFTTRWGMTYRVLVIPQSHKLNPNRLDGRLLEKLTWLKLHGVKVIDTIWTDEDLSAIGVQRDLQLPAGVDFAHRKTADADLFFISNLSETRVALSLPTANNCYLADPLTGKIFSYHGEELSLEASQSLFLVHSTHKIDQSLVSERINYSQTTRLSDWTVSFPKINYQTTATDTLRSWSHDPRTRYFSGRAVYASHFETTDCRPTVVRLPEVHDVATVRVNGIDCGTAWTTPYIIDITSALKRGQNAIEIEVVNTWANALLGARVGEPPFGGIWTNGRYQLEGDEPLTAGLVGVVLVCQEGE